MTWLVRLLGALVLVAAAPWPAGGGEVATSVASAIDPSPTDANEVGVDTTRGALPGSRAELPPSPVPLATETKLGPRVLAASHGRTPVGHLRPHRDDGPWARPGGDVPRMDDDDDPAPAA